jgi:hypothetical protein
MAIVRLDVPTERVLKRLAARRGQTRSQVIRDAILRLADEDRERPTAYDALLPYLGIVDTGGQQLSTDPGKKFRSILEKPRRARRSG